jgi:hypothetical protein
MVRDGGAKQVWNGGRSHNQEERNHDQWFTEKIVVSSFHEFPAPRAVTGIIGVVFCSLTWGPAGLPRSPSKCFEAPNSSAGRGFAGHKMVKIPKTGDFLFRHAPRFPSLSRLAFLNHSPVRVWSENNYAFA